MFPTSHDAHAGKRPSNLRRRVHTFAAYAVLALWVSYIALFIHMFAA